MSEGWLRRRLRDLAEVLQDGVKSMVEDPFGSTAALADSLKAGTPDDRPHRAKLQALFEDANRVAAGTGGAQATKDLVIEVNKHVVKIVEARAKIDAGLAKPEFTVGDGKDAGVAIGKAVAAGQAMIELIAKHVAAGATATENEIKGELQPWNTVLSAALSGVPADLFDFIAGAILGVNDAAGALSKTLEIDFDAKRVKAVLVTVGDHAFGPMISFNGGRLEAFVQWEERGKTPGEDPAKAGISISTGLKAGLRADPMMAKVIPGNAPAADAERAAITLDTDAGLSLGDNKAQRITLPVSFPLPGVELREMALALPKLPGDDPPQRIDVTATVAIKLGSILLVIAEGAGVSLIAVGDGPFEAVPKRPDGLGLRIAAGPFTGGGYLRYREPPADDYGGVLQIGLGRLGLVGAGVFQPSSGALVVVMGIRFAPAIPIGFGFTINGIGGLLASERRVSVDALSKLLSDGAVSNILLPADPIAAAPKILDQLGEVFPPEPGSFVIGPILEIGWGSVDGLVSAKVALLVAIPDPTILVLGALAVSVPPKLKEGTKHKVVDLKVDLFAAISPDEFFLKATLRDSKIQGLEISGDVGILIRWAGDEAFAISAGGFYPTYLFPPKLAGMKRLTVKLDPPFGWIKLSVSAYVALTSNSLQFGGALDIEAKVGPAKGTASVSLDAMFVWSPRFAFIVEFRAKVNIKVFGKNIAGAEFKGRLSGTAPWSVYGAASVSILWWDVEFDVGPIEWGERDTSVLPIVDTMGAVAAALGRDEAWTAIAPGLADGVTLPAPAEAAPPLLLQPYSLIQALQTQVPLEVEIKRTGTYRSSVKQLNIANPRIGDTPAPAFSDVQAKFAMGQFLELTTDEQAKRPDFEDQVAGIQLSPIEATVASAAVDATVNWETFYPRLVKPPVFMAWLLIGSFAHLMLNAGAAARTRRHTGNPYLDPKPSTLKVADPGLAVVVPLAETGHVMATVPMTYTAAAAQAASATAQGQAMQVVELGLAA